METHTRTTDFYLTRIKNERECERERERVTERERGIEKERA